MITTHCFSSTLPSGIPEDIIMIKIQSALFIPTSDCSEDKSYVIRFDKGRVSYCEVMSRRVLLATKDGQKDSSINFDIKSSITSAGC